MRELTDEEWDYATWKGQPAWSKAYSVLVGVPAFAALVWHAFDEDSMSAATQAVCAFLFATVALAQIFCALKIARRLRASDPEDRAR